MQTEDEGMSNTLPSKTVNKTNPFLLDFNYESKKFFDDDEENDSYSWGSNKSTGEGDECESSNKDFINRFESSVNFQNVSAELEEFNATEPQCLDLKFDIPALPPSIDHQTNVEEVKEIQTNFKMSTKAPRERVENRLDYFIKRIKARAGKYLIKSLNRLSKSHFYLPNYAKFTKEVDIEKNKQWLSWPLKKILITYDKNSSKSNKSIISKMEISPDSNNTILQILSKRYEELIIEYLNSDQFLQDNRDLNEEFKTKYLLFCGTNKGSFIDYFQHSKGNIKKKPKGIKA